MEKNLSRFMLSGLTYDQLNSLSTLSHRVYDLPSLDLLFNVLPMQNLFLIYST